MVCSEKVLKGSIERAKSKHFKESSNLFSDLKHAPNNLIEIISTFITQGINMLGINC